MGECSDLLGDGRAHDLLAHISKKPNKRNSGKTLLARGKPEEWAEELGLPQPTVLTLLDQLYEDGFVTNRSGRYVINRRCACRTNGFDAVALGSSQAQEQAHSSWASRPCVGARQHTPERAAPANPVDICYSDEPTETPSAMANATYWGGEDEVPSRPSGAPALARLFVSEVSWRAKRAGIPLLPTAINWKPLLGQFKKLLDGGMEPDEVEAMIYLFARQYRRYHKRGADPGVVFIANRRRLHEQAQRKARLDRVDDKPADWVYDSADDI